MIYAWSQEVFYTFCKGLASVVLSHLLALDVVQFCSKLCSTLSLCHAHFLLPDTLQGFSAAGLKPSSPQKSSPRPLSSPSHYAMLLSLSRQDLQPLQLFMVHFCPASQPDRFSSLNSLHLAFSLILPLSIPGLCPRVIKILFCFCYFGPSQSLCAETLSKLRQGHHLCVLHGNADNLLSTDTEVYIVCSTSHHT